MELQSPLPLLPFPGKYKIGESLPQKFDYWPQLENQ